MTSKVGRLIHAGTSRQIEEGDAAEACKTGVLRAGNSGIILPDGTIVASCAAQTYLRKAGVMAGDPVSESTELMFAAGRSNEDIWAETLRVAGVPGMLREEQTPTRWETDNGTPVTGRPDIVLLRPDGSKDVVIELKLCSAVNSSYGVKIKAEPQLKHVIQTAHYMWQLGIPGELWYTNRTNFDLPDWMKYRPWPKPGEPASASVGYRYYRLGDVNPRTGKPTKHQVSEADYLSGRYPEAFAEAGKLLPFLAGFELRILDDEEGTVQFRRVPELGMPASEPWMNTIVSVNGIKRFFNYVAELTPDSPVPPPAENLDIFGDKLGWKFSDYSKLLDLDPERVGRNVSLGQWVSDVESRWGRKS